MSTQSLPASLLRTSCAWFQEVYFSRQVVAPDQTLSVMFAVGAGEQNRMRCSRGGNAAIKFHVKISWLDLLGFPGSKSSCDADRMRHAEAQHYNNFAVIHDLMVPTRDATAFLLADTFECVSGRPHYTLAMSNAPVPSTVLSCAHASSSFSAVCSRIEYTARAGIHDEHGRRFHRREQPGESYGCYR